MILSSTLPQLLTLARENEAGMVIDVAASHVWKWNQFLPEMLPGPTPKAARAIQYTWNVAEEIANRTDSEPVDQPTVQRALESNCPLGQAAGEHFRGRAAGRGH